MSQHIAHRVEKKQKDFQRGIELHQQGIDKGEFNGQQLQKELERLRTPGKSNNWFTWRRVHSGRGLYASWKDDGFFKYLFKELFVRKRSMPFITAATTWYLLLLNVAWVSDKKATKSENWFPHGAPAGAKLSHHMHELVEHDYGHADSHQAVHLQKE